MGKFGRARDLSDYSEKAIRIEQALAEERRAQEQRAQLAEAVTAAGEVLLSRKAGITSTKA